MKEILRTYNTQFEFVPEIVNEHLIKKGFKQIVLCGMGGSHLSAGILKTIEPGIDIYVHRDYDLPPFSKTFLESALLIASSFSGNTEEVISFYKKTKQLYDLPVLCISTGGELIELARMNNDPYIVLPQTDFEPRTALGITTLALASVFKDKHIQYSIQNLQLAIEELENQALSIFEKINNKTPIFYASTSNLHLAYNWKIKCNETSKKMAFYNVFPEANHNELEGYEYASPDNQFIPVILRDTQDDSRIQKRFDVFEEILKEKDISYIEIDISHVDIVQKVFRSIVLGDFVTALLAEKNNIPQSEVPLIEEFKKRLL
jgi:glucose/mannose-6-phosphate isomerase